MSRRAVARRFFASSFALFTLLACGPSDGAVDAALPPSDGGPATWPVLYAQYFGPASAGSCGVMTGCHASLTDVGGHASNFVCADQDGCYASLTGASHLVRPQDVANPAAAPLFRSLRQIGGMGRMPLNSTFIFHGDDIARLQVWIANGALQD